MIDLIKFTWQPEFKNPSLIVGWEEDAGKLGLRVIDYLNKKLMSQSFCQIKPVDFFSLGGVAIEGDIAQFPESKFYVGERNDLFTFISEFPHFNPYKFLNAILDVAEHYGNIQELYTISGTASFIAHNTPRRILAVFNQPAFQKKLQGYGLKDMTWEGPPHINSYLLWVAKKRGVPGVSLWPQIPFYLAAIEDPQSIKQTLSFLEKRFTLGLDLGELDEKIKDQRIRIAQLRETNPEINRSIEMLETGITLNEEEQMKLAEEVPKFLKKRD